MTTTTKTDKTFTIVTGGDPEFEVHRKGCKAAIRASKEMGRGHYDVKAKSAAAAVASEVAAYQANEQDWDETSFRIHSCCGR